MTYFEVLFFFVVIPIIILAGAHVWHDKNNQPISRQFDLLSPVFMLGLLVFVALIYTTKPTLQLNNCPTGGYRSARQTLTSLT